MGCMNEGLKQLHIKFYSKYINTSSCNNLFNVLTTLHSYY